MAAIPVAGVGVDEVAEVVAVQSGGVGDEHAGGGFGSVDAAGAGAERLRQVGAGHGVPSRVPGPGTAAMTEAAVSR